MFTRVVIAATALSWALAVGLAILWYTQTYAPAPPALSIRAGNSFIFFSLTPEGFALTHYIMGKSADQSSEVGILESFEGATLLFLLLPPAVWVVWKRQLHLRYEDMEDRETFALTPPHWRLPAASLAIGVLGLPAYLALLMAVALLMGKSQWLGATAFALVFPFPVVCTLFFIGSKRRWLGNPYGELGAILTWGWLFFWIAFWVKLIFTPPCFC